MFKFMEEVSKELKDFTDMNKWRVPPSTGRIL
jgi:hypothetical protein